MSYKMIESKGKNGIKPCQHYEPRETEKPASCTNCESIDGEIQSLDGVVTAVSCKLRNNRTPEQIEALKISREVPHTKIKKIGHRNQETPEQKNAFDPERLSQEKLNKKNLDFFE